MSIILPSIIRPQAATMKISPTLEINELVAEARASGQNVVHLGFGEATFPLPPAILDEHRKHVASTSYMPVAGLSELRESIATFSTRRLGVLVEPEQVVVAPGSKPLLFALFDILEGDVLLPRPSWVSYGPQVNHAGKQLFWVETEDDRHTITETSLNAAFDGAIAAGANPRIMLTNTPSNPTGRAFDEATITVISDFCRGKGIVLISDEIYSDLCYDPDFSRLSPYTQLTTENEGQSTTCIITGGLSKTYSAGGWRIGYSIFPRSVAGQALQSAVLSYASENWSAASAPAQKAAALAFQPSAEMDLYRQRAVTLHRACTTRLYSALAGLGLDVPEPQGAFYLYPSFSPWTAQLQYLGVHDSNALAKWLIREFGVATLPGTAFGEDDMDGPPAGRYRLRMATSYLYFENEQERYVRGFGLMEDAAEGKEVALPMLEEAVARLKTVIERLKGIKVEKIDW
ncbi:aminotransferase [Sphaerosporella brunnea]|uniref:Aminotransferase n=1 Tax=Sphaerosporella brunnea TaxID=1250544 RepID=A0A5J5F257_9PEZI|nr:aminotransferase [Sphaerosporella brunnea]